MAAVDRLAFASGALLGLPSSAWAIAEAVAARLRGARSGSGAIEALARQLRPTAFAGVVLDLPRLAREADEARRAAGRAALAVPWVERFNVFTRGENETKADAAAEAASRAELELRHGTTVAQDLFFRAIEPHPVLALHVALGDVRGAVQGLRALPRSSYESARIGGVDRAWAVLRAWSTQAHRLLGGFEPAGDVLERYATAKLRARQGFAP